MTTDHRRQVIDATKQSIPAGVKGTQDENAARGAILSALTMVRELGFKKNEAMALIQQEWLHLVEIDNKTVKGESK